MAAYISDIQEIAQIIESSHNFFLCDRSLAFGDFQFYLDPLEKKSLNFTRPFFFFAP
jgi:hypothetical protein